MNSYLERLRLELEDAVGGAEVGDMAKAPAGKWSAAQILEHLFLSYLHTNRALAKCLELGSPMASRVRLKDRFATLLVVNLGYLPEGRKAPERTVPRGMSPEEARTAIMTELQTMGVGLEDCERRFGVRTKILDHPVIGPLTADEWRKFHWVHGRHHARQIRQRLAS
jgi:hypothetical protein